MTLRNEADILAVMENRTPALWQAPATFWL